MGGGREDVLELITIQACGTGYMGQGVDMGLTLGFFNLDSYLLLLLL